MSCDMLSRGLAKPASFEVWQTLYSADNSAMAPQCTAELNNTSLLGMPL